MEKNVLIENQKKDYPQIVKDIHMDMNNAMDDTLAQAKELISRSKVDNSSKLEKLMRLGNRKSKDFNVNKITEEDVKGAEELIDTINYYRMRYPNNKFILHSDLMSVCEKYGLVFGRFEDYIGFVPEKNADDMLNFKLKEEDILYYRVRKSIRSEDDIEVVSKDHYEKAVADGAPTDYAEVGSNTYCYRKGSEWEIAAPQKEFDMRGKTVENNQIMKKKVTPPQFDPICVQRVKGGYLIGTAWGDEASDPLVANHNNN